MVHELHEPVALLGHAHCPHCRSEAGPRPIRISLLLLAMPWAILASGLGAFVLGSVGCGAAIVFGLGRADGDLVVRAGAALGALAGFAAGAQLAVSILRRSDAS